MIFLPRICYYGGKMKNINPTIAEALAPFAPANEEKNANSYADAQARIVELETALKNLVVSIEHLIKWEVCGEDMNIPESLHLAKGALAKARGAK